MKAKLTTAFLLFVCSLGIGWLAYQDIMWAVSGKQNSWYEYVGFWGCSIMFISGIVALKSFRSGSYLGLLGYLLMLFYFGPALNAGVSVFFRQAGFRKSLKNQGSLTLCCAMAVDRGKKAALYEPHQQALAENFNLTASLK